MLTCKSMSMYVCIIMVLWYYIYIIFWMNVSKMVGFTLLAFLFLILTAVIKTHNDDSDNDWDHQYSKNTNGANNRTKGYITDKKIEQKLVTLAAKVYMRTTYKLTCSWGRGGLYTVTSWSGWVPCCCGLCPITSWRCCVITETINCCISIQMGKKGNTGYANTIKCSVFNLAHFHESEFPVCSSNWSEQHNSNLNDMQVYRTRAFKSSTSNSV